MIFKMGKSSSLRVTGSPIQDDRSASRCSSPRRSRRARASRALFVLGADRQASLREWGEVILNDPAEVSLGLRRSAREVRSDGAGSMLEASQGGRPARKGVVVG